MGEISDEFKIVVVEAVQTLTVKFPKKYRVLLSFLSGALRDEGGFEYKKTIVDSILNVIQQNPEAKEIGTIFCHL
jgi:coatomer protein complex subunit gamma